MTIETTGFQGLFVVIPSLFSDSRGTFSETYRATDFSEYLGFSPQFVQDNESTSAKNVFRGLHYQIPPRAMAKLVRVSHGRVLDVVLDLRKTQPTYGKHFSIELSSSNRKQLFIPEGFAHGFLSLEEGTIFSYKCTDYYSKDHDKALLWSHPDLGISLPCPEPVLSEKDAAADGFLSFESPF